MKGWWLKHCLGGGAVCIIYCGEAVLHKLTDNRSPSRGGGRQYCVSGKLGVCWRIKLIAWRSLLCETRDSREFETNFSKKERKKERKKELKKELKKERKQENGIRNINEPCHDRKPSNRKILKEKLGWRKILEEKQGVSLKILEDMFLAWRRCREAFASLRCVFVPFNIIMLSRSSLF